MTKETDEVVCLLIVAVLFVIDAIQTLYEIVDKGIYKDPRLSLIKKTNKELRLMLQGIKGTNNMRKEELIELVLTNA